MMPSYAALPSSSRRSSRLERQEAVAYDRDGWEIPRQIYSDLCSPTSSEGSSTESDTCSSSDSCPAGPSRRKAVHVPRPRNAFIIFRSDFYARMKTRGADVNQNDLSREAGATWIALSDDEKLPYRKQAEKEKQRHYQLHPDYIYAPVNKAERRRHRNGTGSSKNRATTTTRRTRSSLSQRTSTIQCIKAESTALAQRAHLSSLADRPSTKTMPQRAHRVVGPAEDFADPGLIAGSYTVPRYLDESLMYPMDLLPPQDSSSSLIYPYAEPTEEAPAEPEYYDDPIRPTTHDRVPQLNSNLDLASVAGWELSDIIDNDAFCQGASMDSAGMTSHLDKYAYAAWDGFYNDMFHHNTSVGLHADWNPIRTALDAYGDMSNFDLKAGIFPDNVDTVEMGKILEYPYKLFDQDSSL
ncbi:hypothetical protein AMATHDRAFT_3809 [Amanita thiersii Skay4041]|uniref:HMG box domain-containing protein n=1 Tax=Amanita thiersii Skay4041 TaxID=703135 RepID=A0A2A9NQN5_9AGAR|nr:hypothetical protein AMATHDRAFT_3809 [Amanita thiersii Skay4041]